MEVLQWKYYCQVRTKSAGYMSGYTVKQIIPMVYSCTAKVMKKAVAYYVERAIAEYHYWEDAEE